jgi:hypothetical protein
MLNPPTPAADKEPKRSEAVHIIDRLEQQPDGWVRSVTFCFEGDDHWYGLQAHSARTEEDARRVLYGDRPTKELRELFLRDVRLDETRKH